MIIILINKHKRFYSFSLTKLGTWQQPANLPGNNIVFFPLLDRANQWGQLCPTALSKFANRQSLHKYGEHHDRIGNGHDNIPFRT